MKIALLGPVELVGDDGAPIELGSRRHRQLLAVLALRRGQVVAADALIDVIWGESLPADPAATLQTNVSRLRRLLPSPVELATHPTGYALRCPPEELDISCFEELVMTARTAPPDERLRLVVEALSLWRGAPWPDLDHADLEPHRQRFVELRAEAVEAQAGALADLGRHGEAIEVLEAHVHGHPQREQPVATLMRSLYALGRQADALEAYARLRDRLLDDLGVDPSPELRDLEVAVLRQEVETVAPAPPAAGNRAPLAAEPSAREPVLPVSSFVGRDDELVEVAQLVRRCPLVTIVGPGGVGKTRLSLQLAVTHARETARVACIVELAELRPSDDLVAAVATNLRIGEQQEELSEAVLIDALRRQPPVLVLDNCEHVLDSVSPLAEHLAAAVPGITVIATSREPLHVDGEHRWTLGPLAADDAARLFLDRAAAADPGFAPDDEASGPVSSICARLDGLPLAIELAAAALASMDLDQLADGLDHRFQLLSQGRRTASERHRSLHALVAWSFERLTPEQQGVLETLSTFAGSFSAVGAESLAGPAARWILPELVDRSLVVRERSSTGDRYALLETIRAFAREHLDAKTLDDLQRRHTAWVLDVVRAARVGLLGPDERAWSFRLDADFAELRAAHRYLIEHGQDDDLAELVASLMWWAWAGARAEALGWLEAAVDAGPQIDAAALVRLEIGGAMAAAQRGAFAEAIERCERGLARGVEHGLDTQAAHHALADVYLLYGDLEASQLHAERSYDEATGRRDRWIRCQSAVSMCLTLTYQGDFEAAARWSDLAIAAGEEAEAPTALAWAYYARGEMLADLDPAEASVALARCLELVDTNHASFLHGVCSLTALTVRGRTGDPNEVLTEYPALIQRWHRVGAWPQLWTTLRTAAELLVRAGRFDDAALLLGAIEQRAEAIPTFGADEARYAAVCTEARAALGDRADEAFASGAGLSDDEVVRAALAIVEGEKAR